jgi:hypothetical protein
MGGGTRDDPAACGVGKASRRPSVKLTAAPLCSIRQVKKRILLRSRLIEFINEIWPCFAFMSRAIPPMGILKRSDDNRVGCGAR